MIRRRAWLTRSWDTTAKVRDSQADNNSPGAILSAIIQCTIKSTGDLRFEEWLADGSLRVVLEMNASIRGQFLDRLGAVTRDLPK